MSPFILLFFLHSPILIRNQEIKKISDFPFFPSPPLLLKTDSMGPWYKNLQNHNPLSFPLFHNPQPRTLNSPPPSCSPWLPNPIHRVSSNRSSLCPLNPCTRLDFLNQVRSPLAPLILSWNFTALIHLHWLTTKGMMPSM